MNLSEISLNDLTNMFHNQLLKLLDKHCPVLIKKEKRRKSKKDKWFDSELKQLLNKCRAAESKWRKTKLLVDKSKYKNAQKLYKVTVKLKRKMHHSKSITFSKNNKRQLFSKLQEFTG